MKKYNSVLLTVIGILCVAAGFLLSDRFGGTAEVLPYVLIGAGCGLFGQGLGQMVRRLSLKNYPEIAKQQEIEASDERNQAISHLAKARAFDWMSYTFGALLVTFALMEVDLAALLLLVAVYLFVHGYAIYQSVKLRREM